jgi:DNA repair exonuclease SbcCD ATPase subunit
MDPVSQVDATNWQEALPGVQIEVSQAGARSATYVLDGADFLVGSVPGCDLRVSADVAAVLCVFARQPGGVTLRKLVPSCTILVNGSSVSQADLKDGDQVQIGHVAIALRVEASEVDEARKSLHASMAEFRTQVTRFQAEKAAFERDRTKQPAADWEKQRAELLKQLSERKVLLEERALEIDRQKEELIRTRAEMTDLRRQLYDHYQDRREQLVSMQDGLDSSRREIAERTKKLALAEQDAADRRDRDRERQAELQKRDDELTKGLVRLDEERRQFEAQQQATLDSWTGRISDLETREKELAQKSADLEGKLKQYQADIVRLHRRETALEDRVVELKKLEDDLAVRREQLQLDTSEAEERLAQIDEIQTKLTEEVETLAGQKAEQEAVARQLAERTAAVEGQQATLAVLRGKLERMRDDIRTREQDAENLRGEVATSAAELSEKQRLLETARLEFEAEQQQQAQERAHWSQRSALLDAAVRQLKQAQENLALEDERVRRAGQEIDERRHKLDESEALLRSRLAQLAEAHERADIERKALQERSINLTEREQACVALQEQLQRRAHEVADRHKEGADRLKEYQTSLADLDARRAELEQREVRARQELQALRDDIDARAAELQKKHAEVALFAQTHVAEMNDLAVQRRAVAEERAAFGLEKQQALDKVGQARAELEMLRNETLQLVQHLPDAELRAGAAVERMSHAREQLRSHLDEIHKYVRACHDELADLRGKLQSDADQLTHQEAELRRQQDEHRLSVVAFKQQMIEWQGQITEAQRAMSRDETRLARKNAQADERVKAIEEQSQRLVKQAEVLHGQERDVAERRHEMDRHLGDMREWYRKKLRELAGIPLVPPVVGTDVEPTILPAPIVPAVEETSEDGESGIVPTGRSILSIASAVDAGDAKLGQVLRDLQLVEPDTLTALLAEARRQRRSLRQVLLASGVITLYQLALIEAGNLSGLVLGPVRIIDRVRTSAHESVYRVFDPRRGVEAVLRHLGEAVMSDPIKPDEFRQLFDQARLNDPHVANTLEVLDLAGRPAVVQEWLTGLPSSDWPPLAAAPGVCHRLLTQAAQGLAAVHKAGMVHGHLSDGLLLLTGDGVLKICGLGEPSWLIGVQPEEEPTPRDDLRAVGKIAAGWCTPSGVRKGPKTKPLPDALVSILYRLTADGDPGYRNVAELLGDLQQAATDIPANSEAWERLLKYVRENGDAEAALRQSA